MASSLSPFSLFSLSRLSSSYPIAFPLSAIPHLSSFLKLFFLSSFLFLLSLLLCFSSLSLCVSLLLTSVSHSLFPFLLKPSSHYASFTLLDAHHERQIHGTYRGCHHPSQIPNSFCPEIHLVCQTCPGRDSVILQGILLSVQHYASLIMCSFYCGYLSYLFSTEQ